MKQENPSLSTDEKMMSNVCMRNVAMWIGNKRMEIEIGREM